jgi:glycosyltransferase involved in cell wall biosynthesis
LVDERGARLPYVALTAPMLTQQDRERLARLRESTPLVGFTSYMDFPARRRAWADYDYRSMCVAWCHCFRQPERYLSEGTRRVQLTHADFLDWSDVTPNLGSPLEPRKYDFVYVCESGPWQEYAKNWRLARRCLPVLCDDLGLTGVLVGRPTLADVPEPCAGVEVLGRLPRQDLMNVIAGARFLFVPNVLDASPRIIAEALACNTAVIVNRRIVGGWHYVTPYTGAFFGDETDLAPAIRRCFSQPLSPRRWFTANHGYPRAARRLARFMTEIDGSLGPYRTVHLEPLA